MKLALAILLLTSATLCAQEPASIEPVPLEAKVVLRAPSSARVGELVRLDASDSTADSFRWLLVPESVTDWEVYAEGRKAVFSARAPGIYRFIVAAAKDGTVDVITHVITVRGPPELPATENLAEWIPYWAWNYNLSREEAQLLADSFESVATSVPPLATPKEWATKTLESNRKALGENLDSWAPILDKITLVMVKRAKAGLLQTPEQHTALWMEISEGFRRL